MKTYVPRPDTFSAKAIEYLRARPGVWAPSAELARTIGCDLSSLRNVLEWAIVNEAIMRERRGMTNWYTLGPRAPGPELAEQRARATPVRSVFELAGPAPSAARLAARFGVFSDGRIRVERMGQVTEQFSPDEARELKRLLEGDLFEAAR